MAEQKKLKQTYAKFVAVGKVKLNQNSFEIDVESKNNKDYIYSKAQFNLDCGKERLSFAQLMGGYNTEDPQAFRVFGKDESGRDDYTNRFEVEWDDREDEDVIKSVAQNNLITVGLEKDDKGDILYKKFLSEYDAISYVQEHLKDGDIVKVRGDLKYQIYKGKTSIQKHIKSIYLTKIKKVEEENHEVKTEEVDKTSFYSTFRQQILIDKESLDSKKDDDGLLTLFGYVIQYDRSSRSNAMLPVSIKIDPSRYKKWDITKKKFQPIKKQVWVWGIEGKFQQFTQTVETTVDDLSEDLRDMIDEGLITEAEARTRAVAGNNSKEIMIFNSFLTRKNKDGVDVYDKDDYTYTIEDYVFVKEDESKDEVIVDNDKPSKRQTRKDPFKGLDDTKVTIDDDFADLLSGL